LMGIYEKLFVSESLSYSIYSYIKELYSVVSLSHHWMIISNLFLWDRSLVKMNSYILTSAMSDPRELKLLHSILLFNMINIHTYSSCLHHPHTTNSAWWKEGKQIIYAWGLSGI
jgi:hypothetical protein